MSHLVWQNKTNKCIIVSSTRLFKGKRARVPRLTISPCLTDRRLLRVRRCFLHSSQQKRQKRRPLPFAFHWGLVHADRKTIPLSPSLFLVSSNVFNMLVSWWARLPVRQWAIKENLNWKLSHHIWDHYMNPADLSFHLGIRLFHFRQRCWCLLHPRLEMTVTGGLAGRAATADQPRLKGKQQKTLFCPFKITYPPLFHVVLAHCSGATGLHPKHSHPPRQGQCVTQNRLQGLWQCVRGETHC